MNSQEERRKTVTLTEEDFQRLVRKLSCHLEERLDQVEGKFMENTEQMREIFRNLENSISTSQNQNMEILQEINGDGDQLVGLRKKIEELEKKTNKIDRTWFYLCIFFVATAVIIGYFFYRLIFL